MTTTTTNSNSNKDSSTTNQTTETKPASGYDAKPVDDKKPADEKSTHDDFGYKKDDAKPVDDKKPADKKEDDQPVEDKATGYGKEAPAEDAKPADDKKPADETTGEETPEQKLKKELDEVVKELPKNFDKEKVLKFATETKLSKDQLAAYVKLVKEEEATITKQAEADKKAQRSAWHKELKDDPDFGGENFDKNVDRVEKVLKNFMPNTKKVLTERGSMMPPYIMRDLLGIFKALNPKADFVSGEASTPREEEGNFLDKMYS